MIYKIAALVEYALVLLELTGLVHSKQLPVGGGQLQQLGVIWGIADLSQRGLEILRHWLKVLRQGRRK
jgi:hypothetical protein